MKIYFNDLAVFLISQPTQPLQSRFDNSVSFTFSPTKDSSNKKLQDLLQQLMAGHLTDADALFFIVEQEEELPLLRQQFVQFFRPIAAAGGVVFNENKAALFIYRNDKWDLPKGKIEQGETIPVAAIREVMEETGLKNIELNDPIFPSDATDPVTYHTYTDRKGRAVLKTTYWFMMSCSTAHQVLVPQAEEGITKVEWIDLEQLSPYLSDTYPSIKDVVMGMAS